LPEKSAHHHVLKNEKEERLSDTITRKMIVGDNEMLGYIYLKKGAMVPTHKHVSEQITIIQKGVLEFTLQGKKIAVREGEILVIPPNVEHSAEALEDTIDLDCFSPLREDWISGTDQYLRK
jgi:quercetin dioxygenase-like cupin family protein